MRPTLLVVLLLSGCVSHRFVMYAVTGRAPADVEAVEVDVAALASTGAARQRAREHVLDALDRKLPVEISTASEVQWCVSPRSLLETREDVEKRAVLLVEAGDLDEAVWELTRVGSSSPVLSVARALASQRAGPPSVSPELGAFPEGFVVGACLRAEDVTVVEGRGPEEEILLGYRGAEVVWRLSLGVPAGTFRLVVRGGRVFAASIDRVLAVDARRGEIVWSHVRRAWRSDPTGSWAAAAAAHPFTLEVGLESIVLARGDDYPSERLDPATGRVVEVKLGSLGLALPEWQSGREFG